MEAPEYTSQRRHEASRHTFRMRPCRCGHAAAAAPAAAHNGSPLLTPALGPRQLELAKHPLIERRIHVVHAVVIVAQHALVAVRRAAAAAAGPLARRLAVVAWYTKRQNHTADVET